MAVQQSECVAFLQWALPQLKMRWGGFRRVHKRVCKRLVRRLAELNLIDLEQYRDHLAMHPEEWQRLDVLCRVVVTRFYRDRQVFAELAERVLPALAREAQRGGKEGLRLWSIGIASGEEAYSLAILWHQRLAKAFPQLQFSILGTEVDPLLIARAQRACYPYGAIKNLPHELLTAAFSLCGDDYCLRAHYLPLVSFCQQDIRSELPEGEFDLILCRNLVFTYFDRALQQATLQRILTRLRRGGWLLLGVHEVLPDDGCELEVISQRLGLYQRGQDDTCSTSCHS